jgi:predicted transcriptional regulator
MAEERTADEMERQQAPREDAAGQEMPARQQEPDGRTVTRLTDPRALRAYAHPVRMALVGLLRSEGALTATRAAELLGESSGSCSFHLRQLAKYGLVEEAGGGTGREKPWRATAMFTDWDPVPRAPETAAATGMLNTVIAERYFEQLMRWLEASPDEPPEWQQAALFGDRILYVTADELAELGRTVRGLVDEYFERLLKPELRPPGARLVSYLHLAFPSDAGRRSTP